jgi:hypothetical protein
MKIHRESWLAWILYSLLALAMFAAFWFYFVLHHLLGFSLLQLVRPFVVLVVILACFAMAAKPSREILINSGRIRPLAVAVWSLLLALSLWCVHYATKFSYLSSSFALVCYIVFPIATTLLGFLTFPIMRRFVDEFMPRDNQDGGNERST